MCETSEHSSGLETSVQERSIQDSESTKQPIPKLLRSLRIVAVSSHHYLGRRYVMEIGCAARARELRVYRSLAQLMDAVSQLGLHTDLVSALYRDLCEEGSCTDLDIVI